ncbi:Hypothetical predicted protein [Podarcis lilfordi]|uniref:Uncharacterized protein n=1 Tax=Podarcis lilfordi TaxID=74358 RepID=A0AA35JPG7_9SAUR|nr:Hypothetical predicted protein [Podarcis lilfordi]
MEERRRETEPGKETECREQSLAACCGVSLGASQTCELYLFLFDVMPLSCLRLQLKIVCLAVLNSEVLQSTFWEK